MAEKEHMNLVIIGHVDHGKSTLTGRILLETGAIEPHVIEKYKKQDPATLTRQEYDEICNSLDAAAAQHNQQGGQA